MIIRRIRRALAIVGLALLALNAVGLFVSMRDNDIYDEKLNGPGQYKIVPEATYRDAVTMTADEVLAAGTKRAGESVGDYTTRLTTAVYRGIAHYWFPRGRFKYALTVPPYENFLLHAASYVKPGQFELYEYFDHKKALERGVGFCTQHVVVLTRMMEAQGVPTRIALFTRHTVALVQVSANPETWWVADPDYGVVMPHDLPVLKKDPMLLASYYLKAGFTPEQVSEMLLPTYATEDYRLVDGPGGYHRWRQYYEPASYVLIWVLPALLIAVGGGALRRTAHSG